MINAKNDCQAEYDSTESDHQAHGRCRRDDRIIRVPPIIKSRTEIQDGERNDPEEAYFGKRREEFIMRIGVDDL